MVLSFLGRLGLIYVVVRPPKVALAGRDFCGEREPEDEPDPEPEPELDPGPGPAIEPDSGPRPDNSDETDPR